MKSQLNIKKRYISLLSGIAMPLAFYFCLPIGMVILLSSHTYAQSEGSAGFDTIIFKKYLSPDKFGVHALGDQNNDGYDDILVYDCNEKKAYVFLGGNPMDTVPVLIIHAGDLLAQRKISILDFNNDGYKDIVYPYIDTNLVPHVNIHWGGPQLSETPNIKLPLPQGSSISFGGTYSLKDFNGDGINDLLITDIYPPYSNNNWGTFYLYAGGTNYDTLPRKIILPDSLNNEKFNHQSLSSGDINGDGLTDFTITGTRPVPGNQIEVFREFYIGNSEWNIEPAAKYYRNSHVFDVSTMLIINDVNGDGRDDILIRRYGDFYPYYYDNYILYGQFPIDTIPKVGLNTQNSGMNYAISLGDVNGDGYNDILANMSVGLGSNSRLWVGGRTMPDLPKQRWGSIDFFGGLIAKVGDVDGDGVDDICVGYSSANQSSCFSNYLYIIKGDTSVKGDTTTGVGIDENNIKIENYYLYEPYPNPFNSSTVISFQLSAFSNIKITVFDMLGREVTTLVNKYMDAGKHQIEFNTKEFELSSGVYLIYYKIMGIDGVVKTETKKITLMK